ncbi:EAL domain-containing protein [Shewanella woodyi]|uniref:EAL domain-containing protein n=1 Tax=Shewanella woodyi TaxID=60961 RepID=UPI0007F9167E|nr:EAL domain-containing protein [Shewanella woodyi]
MYSLDEIEAGLLNDEFILEYLPTIDLNSDRCIGGEALIRWKKDGEIIYPNDFIPTLEGTYLSGILTYWVIEKVAEELGDWIHEHEVKIGINIPPEIIGRGGVPYVLRKCGLLDSSHKILLEITERGVPDSMAVEAINKNSHRLKIALDDIGYDVENLFILSRINVDVVKLDMSFAKKILTDEKEKLLNIIDAFTKSAEVKIIAEGVEDQEQVEIVKSVGIDMAQGWYFSKSVSCTKFKEFYENNN